MCCKIVVVHVVNSMFLELGLCNYRLSWLLSNLDKQVQSNLITCDFNPTEVGLIALRLEFSVFACVQFRSYDPSLVMSQPGFRTDLFRRDLDKVFQLPVDMDCTFFYQLLSLSGSDH